MFKRTPRRANVTRAAGTLLLLVAVVGLIAYVAQNLKRWQAPPAPVPPRQSAEKAPPLLEFTNTMTNGAETRVVAIWEKPDANAPKENQNVIHKEFEASKAGYYDFLFRSLVSRDVEIGLLTSSCGCASVQACVVSADEWTRLRKLQAENPGEPLIFSAEPVWHNLSADPKKKPLSLKPDEHGIIRANWDASKLAGQPLRLVPVVWAQPAGKADERQQYPFGISGVMTRSVRVYPPRVHVGELSARTTGKAEFDVWSSTRDTMDLSLTGPITDPLFVVETTPLSEAQRVSLAARLNADKTFLSDNTLPTRVLSGFHVTVTIHESLNGKQLEQGVFYRRLPIILDGFPNPDLPGPEIVGKVLGDVEIGSGDRIRFKAFDSSAGATMVLDLSTDAKVTLEPYEQRPTILEVKLTHDPKNSTPERNRWKLKVTVPKNSFSGSFTETHAVTLRVVGEPPRFVRIPIEGNVAGR